MFWARPESFAFRCVEKGPLVSGHRAAGYKLIETLIARCRVHGQKELVTRCRHPARTLKEITDDGLGIFRLFAVPYLVCHELPAMACCFSVEDKQIDMTMSPVELGYSPGVCRASFWHGHDLSLQDESKLQLNWISGILLIRLCVLT